MAKYAKPPPDRRGGHIRLYWELVDSPAWRCLSATDQRAYIALHRYLRSTNNGDLSLPLSVARHHGLGHPATLAKSLRALVAVGLLAVTRKGGCTKGGQRLPTLYRFTDHVAYEFPLKNIEASKDTNEWKAVKSLAMGAALVRQAEQKAAEVQAEKKKSQVQKLSVTSSRIEAVERLTTSKIEVCPPLPSSESEAGKSTKKGCKPNASKGSKENADFLQTENHTSKSELLSTVATPMGDCLGTATAVAIVETLPTNGRRSFLVNKEQLAA